MAQGKLEAHQLLVGTWTDESSLENKLPPSPSPAQYRLCLFPVLFRHNIILPEVFVFKYTCLWNGALCCLLMERWQYILTWFRSYYLTSASCIQWHITIIVISPMPFGLGRTHTLLVPLGTAAVLWQESWLIGLYFQMLIWWYSIFSPRTGTVRQSQQQQQ